MRKKSQPRPAAPDFERPLVTVDLVIFTVQDDSLKVLLVRRPSDAAEPFPGKWALPGGFVDVDRDASLVDCALRKLEEKTGVNAPYLEQLGSWGGATRDPRGWSATHAYFALLPIRTIDPAPVGWGNRRAPHHPAIGMSPSSWLPADEAARKRLAFDHSEILATAISRLRGKVEYTSLPAFLLDEPFTLPALQHVYEVVLGRPLDKSAFRKRMLDAGFLEEAGVGQGASGRAAMGYRVRERERATVFPRTFRSGE